MRFPEFCGGTHGGRSQFPAAYRSINLMPERTSDGLALAYTPGLSVFATLPGASVPALYRETVSGRVFAISGNTLYELFAGGTFTARGAIGAGPYSWASNNAGQLMISAGGVGWLYQLQAYSNTSTLVTLAANSLTPIASLAPSFLGSAQCGQSDDYFLTLQPNSRQFQISSLLDGAQWSGLDFGAASGGADNVIAFSVSHRELWLFTGTRVEIYIDSGAANFPFSRLDGTYLETGCAAAGSVCRMDNTLFWLGQDERGAGIVWKANGYTPQRISQDHAIEWFISEYQKAGTIADALAYAYQDSGHTFYVLHFPSATCEPSAQGGMTQGVRQGATWVYDAAANEWHERAYWNIALGQWQAHLGRSQAFAFGQHLVGDYQSGKVYTLSPDNFDDAGNVIRRVRRLPLPASEDNLLFVHELRVAMRVGEGNAADPNPQASLRFSRDGVTWGNERLCGLGAAGNYGTRVRWTKLGSGRRPAIEFATTARVPVYLLDAYLSVTEGTS